MSKQKSGKPEHIIVNNAKARHDYEIGETFEAGLVLEGWEVKSLRAGRAQLKESYVLVKDGEAFLLGSHISPLKAASTHVNPDPVRTRKLLLHEKELFKLSKGVDRQGYTVVALNLHWTRNRVKCKIALGKGKQQHDKRASAKARDWNREKQRLLKVK